MLVLKFALIFLMQIVSSTTVLTGLADVNFKSVLCVNIRFIFFKLLHKFNLFSKKKCVMQ